MISTTRFSTARTRLLGITLVLLGLPFAAPAQYRMEVVFKRGDPIPGTTAEFFDFGRVAALSSERKVLFGANMPMGGLGYWTWTDGEVQFLTGNGQAVADVPGVTIDFSKAPLANMSSDGQVVVQAAVAGSGVTQFDDTITLFESGGSLTTWFREGDSVPMLAGRRYGPLWNTFGPSSLNAGRIAITSTVISENDRSRDAVAVLDRVLLGRVIAQVPFAQDGGPVLMPSMPNEAQFLGFGRPSINRFGQVAFQASGADNQARNLATIYRWSPEGALDLLCSGVLPDLTIGPIGIDDAGVVVFADKYEQQLNFGYRRLQRVMTSRSGEGCSPEPIVAVDSMAPGAGGRRFAILSRAGDENSFPGFEVLADGSVVLVAELDDATKGIWLWTPGENLKKLVIEGEPVPGFGNGVTFDEIRQIATNDRGEVAFSAFLAGPGIGFSNDNGVWLATPDAVNPVLVASDVVEIDGLPGTVGYVSLPNQIGAGERTGSGSDGRPAIINENGDLLLHVYFESQPDAALLLAVRGGLVVNSVGDDEDADDTDGVCDTGSDITRQDNSTEPECTLRAAIQEANRQSGYDEITFDIDASGSVPTISVKSALPSVQEEVGIDGATQAGGLVRIDGAALPGESDGLVVTSGGSTLQGLVVTRFGGSGIVFSGAGGNALFSSFLGTDGAGTTGLGNGGGLRIEHSTGNVVGGSRAAKGNVISGNLGSGVRVALDANANVIQGNFVGVNRSKAIIPNGVGIDIFSSSSNIIGGGGPETGNVISGNVMDGVRLQSELSKNSASTEGNVVSGNVIGSDADGLISLGNERYGVNVEGGTGNWIGGPESGQGNVIVGNEEAGVRIRDGSGNQVLGNHIGVNTELVAIPNLVGILIEDSPSNEIGGDGQFDPNVIAGNDSSGVAVLGESGDYNRIRKNLFFDNGGLPIDLGGDGRTANDLGDGVTNFDTDSGPNDLMNFPAAITFVYDASDNVLRVSGALETADPWSSMVDVYAVNLIDKDGFHEGMTFLGTLAADSQGVIKGTVAGPPPSEFIAATATSSNGSTSEFGIACGDPDGDGSPDSDGDGICDDWEISGIDYDGDGNIDLALSEAPFNARPDRKDIFVEIDFMIDGVFHSDGPLLEALTDVETAFAQAPVSNPDGSEGISLHLMKDEALDHAATTDVLFRRPGSDDDWWDYMYGSPEDPCERAHFGTVDDRAAPNCVARIRSRYLVFHYSLWAHSNAWSPSKRGFADSPGAKTLITLGDFTSRDYKRLSGTSQHKTDYQGRRLTQAGNFMHELGHNLGLSHGGNDEVNCKPNYISVMNYSLAFPNIIPNRPLDYSSAALPPLDEADLDESAGIGGPAGYWTVYNVSSAAGERGIPRVIPANLLDVDFNGVDSDGDNIRSNDLHAQADLNLLSFNGVSYQACGRDVDTDGNELTDAPGLTVLSGYDDWHNLVYNFRNGNHYGGRASMVSIVDEPSAEDLLVAAESFDFDADGLMNADDNCAAIYNPEQEDSDQDGIGDACETGDPTDLMVSLHVEEQYQADFANLVYSLSVINGGPGMATGVVVSTSHPEGLGFIEASTSMGDCNWLGSEVACYIDELPAATSVNVTMTMRSLVDGSFKSNSFVFSDGTDPNPSNNEAAVEANLVGTSTERKAELPLDFALHQSYPNPFNPVTTIQFDVPVASHVRLVVYDVLGRLVTKLLDDNLPAGVHQVHFDAGDLTSGVYFYAVEMGGFKARKTMTLLK